MRSLFVVALILLVQPTHASTRFLLEGDAVSLIVTLGPEVPVPQQVMGIMEVAFSIIHTYVRRSNFAKVDKPIPVLITSSQSKSGREIVQKTEASGELPSIEDALTITMDDGVRIVVIYYDIAMMKDGKERPDSFSRLLIALGHEVIGNVFGETHLLPNRRSSELAAYKASIQFLNWLLGQELTEKSREGLVQGLARERAMRDSWWTIGMGGEYKGDGGCEPSLN